ncbi:MAG: hypothetical protein XD93_0540 [candidate division WS6 bacterium 34_10]|jgi:predicted type IV restriction endonuclease|uniref:Uncharacterized protein n=1 Tax=candidate division WS6 bacterium 34_10 TaxID=1641389 RepID=A0A117M0A1_9BACT|nr:MAG: hypothetical protein XD93_0540 [candidate division WS6 bacterium 34_10]
MSKSNNINPNIYLVTEQSDISEFSQEKILNDLKAIKKAEIRANTKFDITRDKAENEVTRAMDALKLSNPFKGV